MSITTAAVKTSHRKWGVAHAKVAPVANIPMPTALAKRTPDKVKTRKKRKHIVAKVNVGWGNSVYLRGDGGALSWTVGVPLICLMDDQWVWSYLEDSAPREFKFLRNDTDWALGDNHVVIIERLVVLTPQFPEF
jgi:hypothetical protein